MYDVGLARLGGRIREGQRPAGLVLRKRSRQALIVVSHPDFMEENLTMLMDRGLFLGGQGPRHRQRLAGPGVGWPDRQLDLTGARPDRHGVAPRHDRFQVRRDPFPMAHLVGLASLGGGKVKVRVPDQRFVRLVDGQWPVIRCADFIEV